MRRIAAAVLALFPALAWTASTGTWEMNTWQDFVRGRFTGVSLTRDGRLLLAPQLDTLFSSDQPFIWSVARAGNGTLYLGTGHRGRVFQVDAAGAGKLLWTAEEPEVFAVALDARVVLYAATSPNGKVYRIENGTASEYFAPKARYIWSLAFARDGALLVGTGDEGKVYRVTAAGKGEVYYETGQTHVTCLAFDAQGRLLAGSEPNGILYRITAKDQAFVLYDAALPEIRAIVPAADGAIYAAALGGSISRNLAQPAGAGGSGIGGTPVVAPATTITVTEAQGGVEIKPKPEAPKPAPVAAPVIGPGPLLDLSGVEKSAVYKINADNTVETLWTSKEENIYDLVAQGGQLVFSTDGQGRVYRMAPDRKVSLLAQTNEGEALRLIEAGTALITATGNQGKLYRLGDSTGAAGAYESPVHDAGSIARWGRLSWRAEPGSGLRFRVRSGNSARPDRTWSEWSDALADSRGTSVPSPNARYVQWKAEFAAAGGPSPMLDSVALAYLPQNTPPQVKSVNVTTQFVAATGAVKSVAQPATAAYSITVTDTGEAGASTMSGTPTQTLGRSGSRQLQITWQAEDPDGDPLVYVLEFRGEEERQWKTLRANMTESGLTLDGDALADGRYFFRVRASDRPGNAPALARESDLVSAPILVDNTPPVMTTGAPRREGGRVEFDVDASDGSSALRRCEYSVDAGPWSVVEAADGVTDSPRERFVLRIENLAAGEHLIVVRAVDAAGNAGLAKVVVR